MSQSSILYRTLGELRHALRTRLGFVTQGSAADSNREVLNEFLREALDYVYQHLDGLVLVKEARRATSPGAALYDWHNVQEDEPIDAQRVQSIWLATDDTTYRTQLTQGISEVQQALPERGRPTHYDTLNGQLQIYPTPDARYTLFIRYLEPKARLTQDQDRPNLPDDLILLYAIATAKAHYRHPDAAVAGKAFEKLLTVYHTRQHEHRRYFAASSCPASGKVIATANGYEWRSHPW